MRLQCLISHIRSLEMLITKKEVVYKIPMYMEKGLLGNLIKVERVGDTIVLKYSVVPAGPHEELGGGLGGNELG